MKVKRKKRAKRILTFFRFKHGFVEPYSILLDGTFCQAALNFKINLREQMPKYFSGAVELFTTRCVLEELKRLGGQVYGALKICEQFELVNCAHSPALTAADCLRQMCLRAKQPEQQQFAVASQDEKLLFDLRDLGGVPLLSIKFHSLLLEEPSKASLNVNNETISELKSVENLKKQILGEPVAESKHKKKKTKGPNPLSCKKKQKRLQLAPKPVEPSTEKKKCSRRRKKKKLST